MKVDSSTADSYIGSVAGGPHKTAQPAAPVEGAAKTGTPQPGVTLTLSSAAAAGSNSSDVFNSEKVEAMKAAIANGSFQVNAEAIADKLLSNAAEMLRGGRA